MTKLFKVALISLAVIAGAGAAQAGGSYDSNESTFSADQYFDQFDKAGWG